MAAVSTGEANRRMPADRWIRSTTTVAVATLALIAGIVSFGHMHELALRAGEARLTAMLIPFSVDGMILASSMSLLVDSRSGRRGGVLPWTLLILGSGASLAANVAAATPTLEGRVIAAWPSFALMGAYELLMRQIRHSAGDRPDVERDVAVMADTQAQDAAASFLPQQVAGAERRQHPAANPAEVRASEPASRTRGRMRPDSPRLANARILQERARRWALDHRAADGTFPTGSQIAEQFGRSGRWGRLIKQAAKADGSTEELAA